MPHCHSHRSHSPRGFSLLLALGLVAAITLAALFSLSYVSQTNEVQGKTRRSKEAFFAAQAGLAEAKERLRILAGPSSTSYTAAMATLGIFPTTDPAHPDPLSPNNEWYQIIPPSAYGLSRVSVTGANSAVDDLLSTPNREMNGPSGAQFADYPSQRNISYRVFLRDDFDEAPPAAQNETQDVNGQVWLVAIGQVTQSGGGSPLQSIVTALVANGTAGGGLQNGTSQRVNNVASADSGAPNGSGAVDLK
jgi:hypothetical protein